MALAVPNAFLEQVPDLFCRNKRVVTRIDTDGFGPVARRTQAQRTMDEAMDAFESGNLSEARALCDRVIALDPLADGVVQLSLEIDARIADKRALEAAASGGE